MNKRLQRLDRFNDWTLGWTYPASETDCIHLYFTALFNENKVHVRYLINQFYKLIYSKIWSYIGCHFSAEKPICFLLNKSSSVTIHWSWRLKNKKQGTVFRFHHIKYFLIYSASLLFHSFQPLMFFHLQYERAIFNARHSKVFETLT